MNKYRCTESFAVMLCDDDGFSMDKEKAVEAGSEWQQTENYVIGGEIHLERIGAEWEWLEVTKEHLETYFEKE